MYFLADCCWYRGNGCFMAGYLILRLFSQSICFKSGNSGSLMSSFPIFQCCNRCFLPLFYFFVHFSKRANVWHHLSWNLFMEFDVNVICPHALLHHHSSSRPCRGPPWNVRWCLKTWNQVMLQSLFMVQPPLLTGFHSPAPATLAHLPHSQKTTSLLFKWETTGCSLWRLGLRVRAQCCLLRRPGMCVSWSASLSLPWGF
jgi:hypothetical protein